MLFEGTPSAPRDIITKAQLRAPKPTLVVGADTPLVLESVAEAVENRLIAPILLGDREKMSRAAEDIGFGLEAHESVEAKGDDAVVAAMIEAANRADVGAIMKGQISTDKFMAGLLNKAAGLRTGVRMTHAFYMSFPQSDRRLIISDAALNVAPDEKTFQAIVQNSANLAIELGVERPKVALLSATEKPNESMPSSMMAKEIANWAIGAVPRADVSGPFALDNAISPKAASLKGMSDPVAGYADVIVVPSIETGNALFKSLSYFAGACAAGLVLGGRLPVILTSRASPPAARITSAAIATLVSENKG